MVLRLLLSLALLAATSCQGREYLPPLPPGDHDAQPMDSSTDEPDVTPDADGDAAPDGDRGLTVECGYPTSGYGYLEGRTLEPFGLWTCDGRSTHLSRLWCEHQATIIHLSVAWCGVCAQGINDLNVEVMGALEGEPVALVEVLLENHPDQIPGEDECEDWSHFFDPPVTVHIPPEGRLTGALWELAEEDALPLTIVIDNEGVIRIWSPAVVPFDLVDQIRELLD